MAEDGEPKMQSFKLHKSQKPKRPLGVRILLWIVGAFILIGILGAIGSSNSKLPSATNAATTTTNAAATNSPSTANAPATTAGLNQQANDGKLGFTVTKLQCNVYAITQPGDTYGYATTTKGNPYCVVNLSVKGVSNAAQTFEADSQYLYSSSGTQYSLDSDATIDENASGDNCMLDPTVNPGVSITCSLVFDIPAGVTPTYAMLHDSSLSGGVKVNLQ